MLRLIHTVGYQLATQPSLISTLTDNGIELLADVRARAQSRKPGFSKSNLAASLLAQGVDYRHFRDLGTPPEGRAAARSGDVETLRRVYAGQLELPEAMAAMAQIRELASQKKTCLMCYCRDAGTCHRALLVKALFADFETVNLVPGVV